MNIEVAFGLYRNDKRLEKIMKHSTKNSKNNLQSLKKLLRTRLVITDYAKYIGSNINYNFKHIKQTFSSLSFCGNYSQSI